MLRSSLQFEPAHDAEFFAAAPAKAAVFLLRGAEGTEPYVSKTSNLRRRMVRLLGAPEERTKRLNLRDRVQGLEYSLVASDFEAQFCLYRTLREIFPSTYTDRLKLRFAPLVRLILENEYPRVAVTTRIQSLKSKSAYYGPFASRVAAEKFSNDALDFFLLRRCTDDLNPDPAFPGCIYSEMKMCLAPCFKGCTDERYAAETASVREFFESGGRSLLRQIEIDRNIASENLEFEKAAELHTKIEKLKAVTQQASELVRNIERLDGVMVQPSQEAESVSLLKISGGFLHDPVPFNVTPRLQVGQVKTPQSMEARLSEALAAVPVQKPASAYEWMEHLALLKRWYYRTSKTGEIFLTDDKGELPYRRLVRGVSRVYKGEKPQADLSETAGDYWRFRAAEGGVPDRPSEARGGLGEK
ncbi:UvrB/UvrC protein [Candidatus Koribacter versatilis Ellin345]|uniref:UvrB/UvrC protein n=1 Tax=Koribacter versatilis (strain Ellin345) TaxID=204669 RepID=Q1IVN8_KORVE|nr:UvrB/UvrC motif-containing protein [Candidatus Koribacter versatilis]ABF39062.1 UvrB/UvrC protein [Candidatus Koribacter versatilis Ellin345]